MGHFPDTIAAVLQGRRVNFAYLVEFQFDPEPAYFFSGTGRLTAGGQTWIGLANLGTIEGIEEALNGESAQMQLTLSGAYLSSKLVQLALSEDPAQYIKKLVRIWLQFFNDDWSLLDAPYALAAGLMDGLIVSREEGENGQTIRSVPVTADNIFYGRRIAPNAYYTDSDQRARYPDDPATGLEFIPELQNKTIPVPW